MCRSWVFELVLCLPICKPAPLKRATPKSIVDIRLTDCAEFYITGRCGDFWRDPAKTKTNCLLQLEATNTVWGRWEMGDVSNFKIHRYCGFEVFGKSQRPKQGIPPDNASVWWFLFVF